MAALPVITAKIMALVNGFLTLFVDPVTVGVSTTSNCGIYAVYNASLTDCGREISTTLGSLIVQVLEIASQLMSGLMVNIV